ncbi:MAG: T9SS type A sorting domain-containing protein [Saprospiraceae bacterium]
MENSLSIIQTVQFSVRQFTLFILLCISCINYSDAQAQIQCVNVTVGYSPSTCTAYIDSSTVLAPPFPPNARYRFILDVPGPDLISLDSLIVPFVYAGQTYTLTVQNVNSNPVNSCWSQVQIKDGDAPVVAGAFQNPVFIDCPVDFNTVTFEQVNPGTSITDCASFTQTFNIVQSNLNCTDFWSAQYNGYWVLTDVFGNSDTIPQIIQINRPDLDDYAAPVDTTINCSSSTIPSATGLPTYKGVPLPFVSNSLSFCTVNISYADAIQASSLPGCQNKTILRTWTFMEMCGNNMTMSEDVQIITVVDTTKPIVTPPAVLNFNTNPGLCTSTFMIPAFPASDNCSTPLQYHFSLPLFPDQYVQTPIFSNVPKGDHLLHFDISDACGNVNSGNILVHVIDNELPTNLCKTNMTVSLNSNGTAQIAASTFNLGSYDNCGPVRFKVKRMTGNACQQVPTFNDSIGFCCSDIGNSIMVILRVYDVPVSAGSVADNAYAGHFNDCMVNVQVQNKNAPLISCLPANVTIDCGDPIALNNALQLKPTVTSFTCTAPTITETRDTLMSMCGIDAITRRFFINGNTQVCQQTIDLVNASPFNPGVNWAPADTTIVNCGSSIDTSVTGSYLIPFDLCSSISLNVTDEIFTSVPNACFMVIRTWTLMDMCQQQQGVFMMWTDVQTIIVSDNNAPILAQLPNVVDSLQFPTCDALLPIVLNRAMATDCTPEAQLKYRYSIDYFNDGVYDLVNIPGFDASGNFPKGTHRITFRVEDRCGNLSLPMSFILTIVDTKPPTMIILNGLAINLVNMNGTAMNMIAAISFKNSTAADNCTNAADLLFSFSPNIADSILTVTCNDLGFLVVTIYITDADGNQSLVNTYLDVQDNMNLCTGTTSGSIIYGKISSISGQPLTQVMVKLDKPNMLDETSNSGDYSIGNLIPQNSYTVAPERNSDHKNGISTLDLLLIQKHIIGLQLLDNPYKFVAADANMNGIISVSDVVDLRKIILGKIPELSHGKSWRFVPTDYQFTNSQNPSLISVPESIYYPAVADSKQANFVGVKLGDINLSATVGAKSDLDSRSKKEQAIEFENRDLIAGTIVEIPIYFSNSTSINGLQFALNWDLEDLELIDQQFPALIGFSDDNCSKLSGKLLLSWNSISPFQINSKMPLMNLKFRVKNNVELSMAISLNQTELEGESYNDTDVKSLVLKARSNTVADAKPELYANVPNPFSERTLIRFDLPQASDVILEIRDLTGKLLKSQHAYYEAGAHKWLVQANELGTAGMYFYSIKTGNYSDCKKLILIDGH